MKPYLLQLVSFFCICVSANAQNLEEARAAANSGDYSRALQIWQPLADAANPEALFSIGRMYARGDGMKQNFFQARRYFEMAAAEGYPRAKTYLGKLYQYGDGVPQDLKMSRHWYSEAAKAGEVEAIELLRALPADQAPEQEVVVSPENDIQQQEPAAPVQAQAMDDNFMDPDSPSFGRQHANAIPNPENRPVVAKPGEMLEKPKSSTSSVSFGASPLPQISGNTSAPVATSIPGKNQPLSDAAVFTLVSVVAVLIIMVINGLRLGLTDKMIFYDTGWDLIATLLIWILPALISFPIFIVNVPEQGRPGAQFGDTHGWLMVIPFLVGFAMIAWTVLKSLKNNGLNFGSICVALSKVTLSILVFFYWGKANDRKNSYQVRMNMLIILSLLAWLMSCLVNGSRVREERLQLAGAGT